MEMTKSSSKQESAIQLRDEMHSTMMDNVGIFRNGKDLQKAVDTLDELIERSKNIKLQGTAIGFNPEISLALRMPGMLKLAQCTAYGALQRTESRGAHTREDFPERNDKEWLNRTLAYWKEGETRPELTYEDASPYFEIPPGERGYGGGKIITADIPEEKLRLPKNGADEKKAKQTKKAS
jgi:fumarate reductase flavoprotein subunit